MDIAIRVSIDGEFLNSHSHHVDDDLTHDEVMEEARDFVQGRYDKEEWDEGLVSWEVHYY